MHIHIDYNLGGTDGTTSHNCNRWMRQVNRLAPILGFDGIVAGRTKVKRVPDPSLGMTVTGKVATQVQRVCLGNIPFRAAAVFPAGLRKHFGQAFKYYSKNEMPSGAPKIAVAKRSSE